MAVANHYGARAISGAENVIKQGYLKKCVTPSEPVPSTATQIATNIKQKLEPNRWYVFGVRYGTPYLEYFEKEESVFTGNALYTYNLSTYESLSYTMGRTNTNFSFCIYLTESTIELLAPNRAQMIDWCRCLERHLRNLGLKTKHAKDDHQYSEFPVKPKPPKKSEPPEPLEFFESQAPSVVQEDHEYEEPPFKFDKNDNNNNSDTGEPSPVLPPRIHSKKGSIPRTEDETVFASLYSVNRPAVPEDAHGDQFDEHIDSKVIADKSNDAAGNPDNSEEDDCDILTIEDLALKRSNAPLKNNTNSSGLMNKCSSLPAKVKIPTEVDTSEDSDFVTASFWLRNRVSDPDQVQDSESVDKSQRKLPPLPLDSVSKPPPLPVRKDSKFPSSAMAKSTSPTGGSDSRRSPTLDTLGPAPVPFSAPQNVKPDFGKETVKLVDIDCDAETDIILPPRKVVKDNAVFSKIKGAEKDDTKGSFGDDDGVYETLVDKSGCIVKAVSDEKKVEEEEVYEAAWQGSDCKKGLKHAEELVVDLRKDKCDPASKEVHVKPKQKERNKLSKFFSKKEIELPESLNVDLTSAQSKQNGHGAEEEDSNFYSDFPMKNHNSNPGLNVDSDILRISLENNPLFDPETSPVLPKRSFYRTSAHVSNQVKGSFSQSVTEPKTAVFFADENTYEEVDRQISVNKSVSSPPSPPVKGREKPSHLQHNGVSDEAPVAPPRRNRRTVCESDLRILSENGKQKNVMETEELPRLPVRPDLNKMKTGSSEPAVPPRTYTQVESQRPAPPRPRLVPSNSVMSENDHSRVGARPKGGQLLGRQQSFQSSGLSVMNLKQNQADILKSEIESIGGMMRIIPKVHFQNGIAFVECFERIWIAGWDVKRYPRLYDKFHIGDELISINDVQVTEMSFAQKLVKNVKAENIELTVRRLPNARVFAIQRSMEGESLGIKREGGTAEIVYVDPYGLASQSGLPTKAATMDNMGCCNWVLTEINMRPLNLFFKDQEIEHRLMAVGRDISIVVQPADFIKELKKQLKKLRNHKDFLVQ